MTGLGAASSGLFTDGEYVGHVTSARDAPVRSTYSLIVSVQFAVGVLACVFLALSAALLPGRSAGSVLYLLVSGFQSVCVCVCVCVLAVACCVRQSCDAGCDAGCGALLAQCSAV